MKNMMNINATIKYPEKMCSSCEFIRKVYDKHNSTEKKPIYYYICSKSNMIIGPAWIKCDDKYINKKEEN